MRPPELSDTLYFGGGTPSLTPVSIVEDLIRAMPLSNDAEITLEANPDDVTEKTLSGWLKAGINRLSLGVQSLEELALHSMLRKHSAYDSLLAIEKTKQAGFSNISCDLILGSPGQTPEGFILGLSQLIDFRPQHLSLYLIEVHEGTLLERGVRNGKMAVMKENTQVDCYNQALTFLKSNGYIHYEVSNFALAGFESRHNLKYWTSAPYYAYGAGACSFYDRKRISNVREISDYIEALAGGRLPVKSEVIEDTETEARNALIFGLRKIEGVEITGFQNKYGIHPLSLFENQGSLFLEEGFLEEKNGHLRITSNGLLVSNEILSSAF